MFLPKIQHGTFRWEGQRQTRYYAIIPEEIHNNAVPTEALNEILYKLWSLQKPNLLLKVDSNELPVDENILEDHLASDQFKSVASDGQQIKASALYERPQYTNNQSSPSLIRDDQSTTSYDPYLNLYVNERMDEIATPQQDESAFRWKNAISRFASTTLEKTTPKEAYVNAGTQDCNSPQSCNEISPELKRARAAIRSKVRHILDAVVNTAEQTHSWIVCGRSAPGMSHIDVVMEEILPQSGAHPTILVSDFIDRTEYEILSPHLHQKLLDSAVNGDEAVKAITELPEVFDPSSKFWADLVNNEGPHKGDSLSEMAAWVTKNERGPLTRFPALCGSHYIFFQSGASTKPQGTIASPLVRDKFMALGELSYVFLGGGPLIAKRILEAYGLGKPSLLVTNTGGATHAAASIHEIISSEIKRKDVNKFYGLRLPITQDEFSATLKHDELGLARRILDVVNAEKHNNPPKEKEYFSFADILTLMHFYRARPPLFHKTIQVVDPLKQTPAKLLQTLSACLGSTYTGTLELGGTEALESMIVKAWEIHSELDRTCDKHGWRSELLQCAVLLCNFFSTTLAVMMEYAKTKPHLLKHLEHRKYWGLIKLASIVLPALGGLCTTIATRFQYTSKWGQYKFACAQIVSEIYKFRMRVGSYSNAISTPESASSSLLAKRAREIFTKTVGDVAARADQLGVSDEARSKAPLIKLTHHINKSVLGERFLPRLENGNAKTASSDGPGEIEMIELGKRELLEQNVEHDDFVRFLSADTYLEYRVKPLIRYYTWLAPRLSRRQFVFEILVICAATVGTLLSALNYSNFVPIAVAFATAVASFMQFMGLRARLTAVNNALRELEGIILNASGLGAVDQSLPSFKTMIVERCETCVLAEYAAWTSATALSTPAKHNGDGNKGHEEHDDKHDKKKEAHSNSSSPKAHPRPSHRSSSVEHGR